MSICSQVVQWVQKRWTGFWVFKCTRDGRKNSRKYSWKWSIWENRDKQSRVFAYQSERVVCGIGDKQNIKKWGAVGTIDRAENIGWFQ